MSRAKGRAGVWRVAALLAGALTQLAGGTALAQSPGRPGLATGVAGQTDGSALARSKLAQARIQLQQGNLDVAERLAQEVSRLNLTWSATEDSPSKVLQDIRDARVDPKTLLLASRTALKRKDFLRAEKYARLADRQSTMFSFPPWGDTPKKALEDIQKARQQAMVHAPRPTSPTVDASKPSESQPSRTVVQNSPTASIPPSGSKPVSSSAGTPSKSMGPNLPSPAPRSLVQNPQVGTPGVQPTTQASSRPTPSAHSLVQSTPTAPRNTGAATSPSKVDPTLAGRSVVQNKPNTLPAWSNQQTAPRTPTERTPLVKGTTGSSALTKGTTAPEKTAPVPSRTPGSVVQTSFEMPELVGPPLPSQTASARQNTSVAGATRSTTGPRTTGSSLIPPAVPPRTTEAPKTVVNESDEARKLLQQARQAITQQQFDEARRLVAMARTKKARLSWWEDNPEKVDLDIRRAEAARKPLPSATNPTAMVKGTPTPGQPTASTLPTKKDPKEAARDMLQTGRQQLAQGKLDEAAQTAQRIKAMTKVSWGLFEDSPDRLSIDVEKARAQRNKEESIRLLAEGRKLYNKGDYEGATRLAYQSQKLYGNHSIWDLGDRPSKLLSDIQTAQARARKTALPPATVVRKDDKQAPVSSPGVATPSSPKAIRDSRPAPSTNSTVARVDHRQHNNAMPPVPGVGVMGTPPAPVKPVQEVRTPEKSPSDRTEVVHATPTPTPAPQGPSPEKLRAQQLVAEAQRLHREGKLLEARNKAMEAQKLQVRFAPEEVTPEFVYQQVAIEIRQKVDGLVRQAHDQVAYGKGDLASRYRQAEFKLEEAHAMATAFGHDTNPIEMRLAEIRSLKSKIVPETRIDSSLAKANHEKAAPIPSAPVPPTSKPMVPSAVPPSTTPAPTPTPAPVVNQGKVLLENARVELRKGETGNARKLAESALTGKYGVEDEAMAILRTIDTEEFNQKQLSANRAFDAAMAAYRRREYNRASAMLAAIDTKLLDAERQGRLREINLTPEVSSGLARSSEQSKQGGHGLVRTAGQEPGPAPSTSGSTLGPLPGTGMAVASDSADGGLLDRHRQMQKVLFDKLRQDGLDVQRDASEKFRAGQADTALEMLQDYLARLDEEKLEPGQLTLLRRPIESRISHFRLLKAQKDLATGALASKQAATDKIASIRRAEEMKQKNIEKLMKDFNTHFKEGKYLEAESLAMRALELDPDNGVASAAVYMARRQRNVTAFRKIKEGREDLTLKALNNAEDEPGAEAIDRGVAYDGERWKQASKRKTLEPTEIGRPSEKQKAIERQLSTPISISFDSTPLSQVLNELRDVHGINIVPDLPAFQEMGISMESPISIKLDRVSLKSALNLILHQVRLTHVIKDEVLMITTEENARGKLKLVSYAVADLVIPVEDFGDIRNPGQPVNSPVSTPAVNYTPTPVTGPQSMVGGTPVGTPLGGGSMLNGTAPNSLSGAATLSTQGGVTTTKRGPLNTTEEHLIKLITSTIQPRTWSEMGGPGTIDYHPMTMSLVINQTQDIQEQIQDLLQALRRLQDQEVAVEVRFISVSEDFFERIGVNFNMNILTHNQRFEPALQQNAFVWDSTQFINAFRPGRFLAGMTPAGTLTPTLDIPINQNSFFTTVPNFGGYAANGLTMGLAFLSDIQVFLFLEAAQGDQRANIMQAPKLTLFNGQTSTLSVNDLQSFVSGVQIAQLAGGQFALLPQNQPVPFGVQLTIQAVISADRRFVRLSLAPFLTNLLPGPVQAFPIVVPIFTSIEGNQAGQPVVFTQFIQQPNITSVSVQTTVAVPDGGTVLMGGLKRLSEARSEYGPPILSKVPYINRLFKNVGYGRETDSLLIMVTPRIIVQAEEEERQTGFVAPVTGAVQ